MKFFFQGTTQAFAGFLDEKVAAKVNVFIALAPAVYVAHTESLVVKALADLPTVEVFNLLGYVFFWREKIISEFVNLKKPKLVNITWKFCLKKILAGKN